MTLASRLIRTHSTNNRNTQLAIATEVQPLRWVPSSVEVVGYLSKKAGELKSPVLSTLLMKIRDAPTPFAKVSGRSHQGCFVSLVQRLAMHTRVVVRSACPIGLCDR